MSIIRKYACLVLLALLEWNAGADVILWKVDDSMFDGQFSAARVMVSPSGNGGDGEVLGTVELNPDTGTFEMAYPDGIAFFNDDTPRTTGEAWALIGNDVDVNVAMFYIELGNYEGSSDNPTWATTVATGEMRSYNWLRDHGALGTADMFANVYWGWDGTPYSVPEPNSGLLLLIGCAFLSLRRGKTRS